jgi:two-component system nitrogen regulation response regulator GlnG/two-component system response regulator HydG
MLKGPAVSCQLMSTTLTLESTESSGRHPVVLPRALGLLLLWSRDEPERVGEVALVPSMAVGALATLGRGEPPEGRALPRMGWVRQQPGRSVPTGPFGSQHISRAQFQLEVLGPRSLRVTNTGRAPLVYEGQEASSAVLAPGALVSLHKLALMMCVERPVHLPSTDPPVVVPPFGEADAQGLVGESPAAWELRARIAFAAAREVHVLVRGPSGTGKELVAQAIHQLSARSSRALVSRNAATFPETLIDAELFGNARGFPNPGMPERPGLVGEADGSTLFLDEFAELPQALQTHLLRVLDAGEYQRLGESRPRHANFRLIAATNRPEQMIKEDVLARFGLRLELSGLEQRPEDIPLIARHLLRMLARSDPKLALRYFPNDDLAACPRVSLALMEYLVRHRYTTHTRELQSLLLHAAFHSSGSTLELWPGEAPLPVPPSPSALPEPPESAGMAAPTAREPAAPTAQDPMSIPPEVIQACLDRHDGQQEPVWRELGLSSRHVLTRLVRRYNLKVRGRARPS